MHEAHKRHHDSPENHDDRNENRRSQALKKDVGQRLKETVRDEEDGESQVVFLTGHREVFVKTGDLGIADVGAVQKGEEVQDTKPRDEGEV